MNFNEILLRAIACNEDAIHTILEMYKPLLLKDSIVNDMFDEDLYQELCITLLNCVRRFEI